MGLGGGRVWGGGEARSAHRGPNCGGCWRGTCGAHPKHLYHGCDAGRAEAQRLVEGRRFLPRTKGKHTKRGGMRAGKREGVERRRRKQRAGASQLWRLLAGHARSARKTCSSCLLRWRYPSSICLR